MDIRTLVEGHPLALEVGNRLDWRVLGQQDGFAQRCRWLVGNVQQVGAGRLGEYRRCLAGGAEVYGAYVQAFEQLRTGRKLGPADVDAVLGQAPFQAAVGAQQHQRSVFLIADTQGLGTGLSYRTDQAGSGQQRCHTPAQGIRVHGSSFCLWCW